VLWWRLMRPNTILLSTTRLQPYGKHRVLSFIVHHVQLHTRVIMWVRSWCKTLIRAVLIAVRVRVILGCAICNAVTALENGPFASIVKMSVSPSLQGIKSAVTMQESTSWFQAQQTHPQVKATRDVELRNWWQLLMLRVTMVPMQVVT
jgi:hypothetical protein